jgi:transcriptional regulator with XRE-family HTH domain
MARRPRKFVERDPQKVVEKIGDNLRQARAEAGLSQRELGKRSGVNAITICRVEQGTENPSVQLLLKLSNALEINVHDLLRDT